MYVGLIEFTFEWSSKEIGAAIKIVNLSQQILASDVIKK